MWSGGALPFKQHGQGLNPSPSIMDQFWANSVVSASSCLQDFFLLVLQSKHFSIKFYLETVDG